MKISIIGFGAMGRLVAESAQLHQIEIASIIDPQQPEATHAEFNANSMENVDVCICFSDPSVAMENIEEACRWKKNIVMATTGWLDQFTIAQQMVQEAGIGMIYSSNFSIGVNIFFKIIEEAAKIIDIFDQYDVLGYELHHSRKKDAPSGTAKTITQILLDNIQRKNTVVEDRLERPIKKEELHFASIRGGDIPGTHTVQFDSKFDSIELKHTARNRMGFAMGSLIAAQWIQNQKGLYTEQDMMNFILNSKNIFFG